MVEEEIKICVVETINIISFCLYVCNKLKKGNNFRIPSSLEQNENVEYIVRNSQSCCST